MRDKRGLAWTWTVLIIVIVLAVGFIFWFGVYPLIKAHQNLGDVTQIEQNLQDKVVWNNASLLGKTKITILSVPSKISSFLGFKSEIEKLKDFWGYFFIGLIAGAWIYLVNLIINLWIKFRIGIKIAKTGALRDLSKQRRGWLELVGGSLWKILIIGMAYGIIMLIPIVKNVIEFITFEYLMPGNWFIRSFIIAFYIGFGPAAIERYYRYRLRMKYYKKFMDVKYGMQTARALSSG